MLTAVDESGCPVVAAADGRIKPPAWTAITVLDDSARALSVEAAHKRRWQAWLYWSNLLQFLEQGGGDSAQLTTSGLDGFSTEVLAVTGGSGWLSSARIELPEAENQAAAAQAVTVPAPALSPAPAPAPAPARASASASATAERDRAWSKVLEYLDPDEPGLPELT